MKNELLNPYIGAVVAFFSGLNISEWGALLGIFFGFCTFIINWHYKRKEFELKEKQLEQQNENVH